MSEKTVVVFTNFWDADTVISNQFFLLNDAQRQKAYKVNLISQPPVNWSVHSIALSAPDLSKKPNMRNMSRIDCFCPTYDMLKRYKADNDWETYTKNFVELIKKRKSEMKDWMESLLDDHVYFLCCWENTKNGAHCHREILYKAISSSKIMTEKIIPIYRTGGCTTKKRTNERLGYEIESEAVPNIGSILDVLAGGRQIRSSPYRSVEPMFNFPFNNPQPPRQSVRGELLDLPPGYERVSEDDGYGNTRIGLRTTEAGRRFRANNPNPDIEESDL